MADVFRYRHGVANPRVSKAPASATLIEIGDLIYQDPSTDVPYPASSQADQGSEGANQDLFHDNFLGVAAQRSRVGDTDAIRVDTTAVFAFACPSGTWELGDFAGVDENAAGTGLLDQTVTSVTIAGFAIGRCAKRVASADTEVLIEITSTVMYGGPQASTPSA